MESQPSSLRSTRKAPAKPWRKPAAAEPAKVFKVDRMDFKEVVQRLTGLKTTPPPPKAPFSDNYSSDPRTLSENVTPGSSELGLGLSPGSCTWWGRPLLSPRTLSSFEHGTVVFTYRYQFPPRARRAASTRRRHHQCRGFDSLRLDDDDEEDEETNAGGAESAIDPKPQQQPQSSSSSSPPTPTTRGVKEDLSEITKTLTTKLWGVASFLASSSEPSSPRQISDPPNWEASEEAVIAGIRSDFAEIGGRVKLGISKLSSNMAVSEISKIASNFLQIGPEEGSLERYESVGVTEEVLGFVNIIAMHPETWLDFPVPDGEDDEFGEFDMSDTQQEHALAVERLVLRLAALRMELCPEYMSDGCFWKIYFVLLHPRLDKHIALLLSTPQIMEARALLTPDLRNRTKTGLKEPTIDISAKEEATPSTVLTDSEMDKHAIQSTETIQVIDKSIIEEKPMKHDPSSSEDENDEWLKEDVSEITSANRTTTTVPISNYEEDVSFSDLEDDDEDDAPAGYKKDGSDSSAKDSQDWVQLGRSSTDSAKDIINNNAADTKRSDQVSSHNDWLDVNDIDAI